MIGKTAKLVNSAATPSVVSAGGTEIHTTVQTHSFI